VIVGLGVDISEVDRIREAILEAFAEYEEKAAVAT